MNVVADEGIDRQVVEALRTAGFRIRYVAEDAPGSSDAHILTAAAESATLLLTADKDFGELVFRQRLVTAGVVLVRLHGFAPELKARVVVDALRSHAPDMLGAFSAIAPGSLRIRTSGAERD